MPKVLSPEWMEQFAQLWNGTPITREGTAALSMVIEYRIAGDGEDPAAGQIEVVEGNAVRAGAPGAEPDYTFTATREVWRQVSVGELDPGRALLGRKVKFRGPAGVAMAHMPSFGAAMGLFGAVQDTAW